MVPVVQRDAAALQEHCIWLPAERTVCDVPRQRLPGSRAVGAVVGLYRTRVAQHLQGGQTQKDASCVLGRVQSHSESEAVTAHLQHICRSLDCWALHPLRVMMQRRVSK